MSYDFQLYIAVFSPSITLRLFDEVVRHGGGDSYEVSKDGGAYVLRSKYISEMEEALIQESTSLSLRTCVSCSVHRPDELNVDDMLIRLIDRTVYEISHDFMLLENGEDIIIVRNDLDLIVTPHMERLDYELHDRSYEVRVLPKLKL